MTSLYARLGGVLLILLAVAAPLYGAYQHGVSVTDLRWNEKLSARDEADTAATLKAT